MSPEEYHRAVGAREGYGDALDHFAEIIWIGGWVPAGIVAIVAGIVVGLISGHWGLFLLIALLGTILGYLAVMSAILAFADLDMRWLRTGRPLEAESAIFLLVGPAVALLVAVLVFIFVS